VWYRNKGTTCFSCLVSVDQIWGGRKLGKRDFLFRMVDLDSSEDLFLLVSFIAEVNLLLGFDSRTINCGIRCHYLSWDNNYVYIG
jgi:hypothetical protein